MSSPTVRRAVQLDRSGATSDVDVYDAAELRAGHVLAGPALVDGADTTLWLPPGGRADVDAHGTVVMEVAS